MTDVRVGTTVELAIERLAYGGDGVARVGSFVVFVPSTAPGERVLARVTELSPRSARAVIERVIAPSAARRAPRCPHVGNCGGCQLQHMTQAAQLDAKVGFLRDALERVGRLHVPVDVQVVSGAEWSYRARAELAVHDGGAGFHRRGGRDLVRIETCPISVATLSSEIAARCADPASIPHGAESLVIDAAGDGVATTPFPASAREDAPKSVERVVKTSGGDFTMRWDARVFFQANAELAPELVRVATEGADAALALDLYAGVGLFTLPLSRRVDTLVAVEQNAIAVAFGRDNTRRNGVTNVRWRTGRVDRWLERSAAELPQVDFVLLDPPRAGAGAAVMRAIAAVSPREIRYVSCDPTTLARDLAVATAAGYALARVVLVDMFPQTTHVEVVAMLERA